MKKKRLATGDQRPGAVAAGLRTGRPKRKRGQCGTGVSPVLSDAALPEGMTCRDCEHHALLRFDNTSTCAIRGGFIKADSTLCDFAPHRFKPRTENRERFQFSILNSQLEAYWLAAHPWQRTRALELIRGADKSANSVLLCSAMNAIGLSNPAALEFLVALLQETRTIAALVSRVRLDLEDLARNAEQQCGTGVSPVISTGPRKRIEHE